MFPEWFSYQSFECLILAPLIKEKLVYVLYAVAFVIRSFANNITCRYQWPRGLRRRSAAAHLLRSWARIPPGAWMFICCECCVLSGRGLCDELITHPGKSYRLCCVVVCDLENLKNEEAMPRVGSQRHSKKKKNHLRCTQFHIKLSLPLQ